jgi:hypothetical protein
MEGKGKAAGGVIVGSIEEVGGVGKGNCGRGCFGGIDGGCGLEKKQEFKGKE